MKECINEKSNSFSDRPYVLGRREKTGAGVLTIGRYYALDGSLGASVFLDVTRPHMVFICGKRGYGKSYTIGVFLEEIAALDEKIRNHLAVIVLDTLGIFWSTRYPSKEGIGKSKQWGRNPSGFPIRLLVPGHASRDSTIQNGSDEPFFLSVASLSPLHWCQLFHVPLTDPIGVILTKVILHLQSTGTRFSLQDVVALVQQDDQTEQVVKTAVQNFFLMADSWGVFDKDGLSIAEIVRPGMVTVLDLSVLPSLLLKDVVVAVLSEALFEERVKARKIYEQKKMGFHIEEEGIPLVWLAVDEAQVFLPAEKTTLSKAVLIEEWMRQGRQPGLSLLLATQRPSAIEPEVLSHCDLFLCHRLTAQEDIDALSKIRPIYLHGDIQESLRKIGTAKGVALLIDDTSESVHVVQVRPRVSWHGGAEPVILSEKQSMDW
jgi:Helicase HerA, central domain